MRVSIQTSTGRVLEMQSDATAGTLIDNAVGAGFVKDDIEEREVTQAEYTALMLIQEPPSSEKKIRVEDLAAALIGKGVLTEQDIDAVKGGK